jgi:hypothetical protein
MEVSRCANLLNRLDVLSLELSSLAANRSIALKNAPVRSSHIKIGISSNYQVAALIGTAAEGR